MLGQLILLSTCGTSVLTNGTDEATRGWLNKIANRPTLPEADQRRLDMHADERRDRLAKADQKQRRRMSAELNGIEAVLERWKPDGVQHLLLHTDTVAGRIAASLIEKNLENRGQQVQLLTAAGLRTDDLPSFREALADLTRQIEDWFAAPRWNTKTVFNLTGGFKSVNAYFQALGMLYAERCVFLFESADALMEIPRLPVRLAEADEIRAHLAVFRRLAHAYPVVEAEAAGVPDALVMIDDGQVTTSVWGDAVWARVQGDLLGEALLPPLSAKLTITGSVRKSFGELEKKRRVQVNQALDALSAHLDGKRDLLKSETFKSLKGNPRPPATHELYAWSDGGAGRIFGHFDGGRFIADFLDSHL